MTSRYQANPKHQPKQRLSKVTSDLMASGWSYDTGRNVGWGNKVKEMKGNSAQIPNDQTHTLVYKM